jgi:hypothetical protein
MFHLKRVLLPRHEKRARSHSLTCYKASVRVALQQGASLPSSTSLAWHCCCELDTEVCQLRGLPRKCRRYSADNGQFRLEVLLLSACFACYVSPVVCSDCVTDQALLWRFRGIVTGIRGRLTAKSIKSSRSSPVSASNPHRRLLNARPHVFRCSYNCLLPQALNLEICRLLETLQSARSFPTTFNTFCPKMAPRILAIARLFMWPRRWHVSPVMSKHFEIHSAQTLLFL